MKKLIITLVTIFVCEFAHSQVQSYDCELFSIEIGEGFYKKQTDANTIQYENPKTLVAIISHPASDAPKDYLIKTNENMLKKASGEYTIDSVLVGKTYIPRSIMTITLPTDNKEYKITSVAFMDSQDKLYSIDFTFSTNDPILQVWATNKIQSIKFNKEIKLSLSDYNLSGQKYLKKQYIRDRKTGSFFVYNKEPQKKDIKGCKVVFSDDNHINIENSKNGLTFLKEWPEFRRSEFGGSKIYSDLFNISIDFSLDKLAKTDYGFGFAFIFFRTGEYSGKSAQYVSFYLTNTGKLLSISKTKKYDEYSMCASCWGTFKKETPKEIFIEENYNSKDIEIKEKRNELKITFVDHTYYVFLNKELVYKVENIEDGVSYDISPIPVLFNKGGVIVYSQSEEFLYD